jgi:cysteine-rich repeat protein
MRTRTFLASTLSSFALMAASACGGDSKSSFSTADSGAGGEAGSTAGSSGGATGDAGAQSSTTGGQAGSATTGVGGASAGAAGSPGSGGSSVAGTSGAGAPGAGGAAPAGAGGVAPAGAAGVVMSAGAAGAAGTPSSAGMPGTAGTPSSAGTTGAGGSVSAGAGGTAGAAGAVTVTPVCGNGVVERGEQCDDGNGVDVDACPDGPSGLCTNASCGDSIVRRDIASGTAGYEQCDDGNTTTGDGCDDSCQLEGTCGDGVADSGEGCDLGSANDDNASGSCPSVCRTSCQCPTCGDGVTDFILGEECDDLNTSDGDGCSATCTVEAAPTCGDGTLDIDQGEECDDGNTAAGDGCDDACQLEPVGQTCGDGNTDTLEKCDDSNGLNGDGCNPTCNLTGTVTTLTTGVIGNALAADDTYLWLGGCDNTGSSPAGCHISRIDIDDCLNNDNCTPTQVVGGSCGAAQDGPAANASIGCVATMTTDGNTLWFGDGRLLRALDIQSMNVTTVAGSQGMCAAIDGTGAGALFHDLRGLTYYGGSVYLLDGCEEVLRRFDPSTNSVTTIAGTRFPDPDIAQTGATRYQCVSTGFTCITGTPADGQGLSAVFGSPRYMTADNSGNLYITDTNGNMLRTYNTVTGWVGTLVGGAQGYVDGVGTAARLDRPRGVTSDGTSVYWAEQNQYTVRQVEIQPAQSSTLIGVRGCAGSADGTGADASQDWSGSCNDPALNGLPNIDTSLGGIVFHFPSQSIFLLEGGRLRRIE